MSAPSTTSTRAVDVTLDANRQIAGVVIRALPDELRSPDGLKAALHRAYLDAVGARLDERLGSTGRSRGERPVARADRTPAPPRSERYGHVPHDELVEFWKRPTALEPRDPGARDTGSSSNGCVHLTLHTTDHFADIDVDPGWLRTANVSSVATAVLEAFADAYTTRNQR
ncbi:hypothetical protein [Nocardioides sp.]|uniref:hypothetical protein n=1 Tax=Nocardioides sp. TaxID=35761 RepID=UPI001A188422|nr:hypothetical protein [Nocardioides sp.]MBJ7359406.1 hypothetical protein [Nocardioides sp.]